MQLREVVVSDDCSVDGVYYKRGEKVMVDDELYAKFEQPTPKIRNDPRVAMRIDLRWTGEEIIRQLAKHSHLTLQILSNCLAEAQERKEESDTI